MQSFYLSKNQDGYYRVRFSDPNTGKLTVAKSTHTKNKNEATIIACRWLENGIPQSKSCDRVINNKNNNALNLNSIVERLSQEEALRLVSLINAKFNFQTVTTTVAAATVSNVTNTSEPIYLIEALRNFWDFNNSEYVKKRIARGFDVKQRNCKEKLGIVNRYWAVYFDAERTVQSLTSKELDEFLLSLRMEKGLSADTVNKTMTAGNMLFEFLIKEELITKNPLNGVERFKVVSKKRGIPTETEMKQLMDLDWNWTDKVNKLAFKVASLFGLRAGEISGLQTCDIDPVADLLYIRHSWNDTDKLKDTKNGDDRVIPIEHNTALELLSQARRNPNYSDTSFVFWSTKVEGQPMWPSSFEDDFYLAMQKIGISEEQRKERNIVFHSLRHYCATQIAQRTTLEIAMKILGHKTEDMTRLYAEHETKVKLDNAKDVLEQGWKLLVA